MYDIKDLVRGIRHPRLVVHECNRLYHRRAGLREWNTAGFDVMESDWDNLVVLDACRYDMFESLDEFDNGSLDCRISRGSSTPEWIRGNIDGRDLTDTVYVTANPNLYRNGAAFEIRFHDIQNVWAEDGWNREYGTVLPETVTQYATDAETEYPNKRLLIHYMQPHYPFLSAANKFYDRSQSMLADDEHFWQELMTGRIDVSREDIWAAYRENLDRVVPSVLSLIDSLSGKTVITSDHGNMIGERACPIPIVEWGHPPGIYTEQLVKVPWFECSFDGRREIIAGSATDQGDPDRDVVSDRLSALGYT